MKIRYDKYREEVETGCKYAEDCFNCPFDDCIISMKEVDDTEEDYKVSRPIVLERARYVKALRDSGMKIKDIAKMLNCAVDTVKRDIIISRTEESKVAKQNGCEKG